MKYIAKKGTQTYDNLKALQDSMRACNVAVKELIEPKFGPVNIYSRRNDTILWGGLAAVEFKTIIPFGWSPVKNGPKNAYYPKQNWKENEEILNQIEALPIVLKDEFFEAVGIPLSKDNYSRQFRFMLVESEDLYALDLFTTEVNPDLEEIVESRYFKLIEVKKVNDEAP